jgi:hypothetical protein
MKKFLMLAFLACAFVYFTPMANAYTGMTVAKKHHKHHKKHHHHTGSNAA